MVTVDEADALPEVHTVVRVAVNDVPLNPSVSAWQVTQRSS